jgi:hypothetical protein
MDKIKTMMLVIFGTIRNQVKEVRLRGCKKSTNKRVIKITGLSVQNLTDAMTYVEILCIIRFIFAE